MIYVINVGGYIGESTRSEIEYAIMEANGQVSFLPKSSAQPVKRKDLKLKTAYERGKN